ncbi:MAG: hypothetical protein ICV61_11440 [Microcoleus sp. Co-bin12]|nr:hypothetical protein [Microcoleus sp. Co-bin12]
MPLFKQDLGRSFSPQTSTNLDRPDSGNQFDENVDTIIQMAETAHPISGF